ATLASAVVVALAFEVPIVGRLHVGYVQEAIAADAKVHERGLDARLDVYDSALVDVAHVAFVASSLDVQLLQHAIFQDGDAAFLGLKDVDEHFLFHARSCLLLRTRTQSRTRTRSRIPSRGSTRSGKGSGFGFVFVPGFGISG